MRMPDGSSPRTPAPCIGDAAPRWVLTPIRSSARRFCAMRAASSVESTRRVPPALATVSAASPIEGRWPMGRTKRAGCIAPLGNGREKTAYLEREGVQDQGAGDDRTQDQSEKLGNSTLTHNQPPNLNVSRASDLFGSNGREPEAAQLLPAADLAGRAQEGQAEGGLAPA